MVRADDTRERIRAAVEALRKAPVRLAEANGDVALALACAVDLALSCLQDDKILVDVDKLEADLTKATDELRNVLLAEPRKWDNVENGAEADNAFRLWAQSRARHTLNKIGAPLTREPAPSLDAVVAENVAHFARRFEARAE